MTTDIDQVTATDPTGSWRNPDWNYVKTLFTQLENQMQGFHIKIGEIEALRYYEDEIPTDPERQHKGYKVRIGLTAELLENIKAALLVNKPIVRFKPLRKHQKAASNASNREHYWQGHLGTLYGGSNAPNLISELVDAQMLGLGIFKSAYAKDKWDLTKRKKKRGESAEEHVDRVNGLKKLWGHPTRSITVHPTAIYVRPGNGARLDEVIEYGYKAKSTVYAKYGLEDIMSGENKLPDSAVATMTTTPNNSNITLPAGIDTTHFVEVYEYWNPGVYKVFVNNNEVYSEVGDPSVCYFMAPGRSSSSKDPDKFSMSVAENLRHNEPVINKLLTDMVEAVDLIVHRRNTLEVPDDYIDPMEAETEDVAGKPKASTWRFTADYAEALPPGAKIKDPFEGVDSVFGAMPAIQLLMQITAQHGISPLFKGISPGAAGSGYRDNSLYTMAKSMFDYIIESLQMCLTEYIIWQEWCHVHHIKQETWQGEYSLNSSDIEDWPCEVTVELKPTIPQNQIAEGEFWARQQQLGNVSKRFVREHGLGIEQPDEMEDEVEFEILWEMLKPILYQDVVATVMGPPPAAAQQAAGEESSGIVGPDGTPISSQQMMQQGGGAGVNGAGRGVGRELGGYATQGQPKQPSKQPTQTVG